MVELGFIQQQLESIQGICDKLVIPAKARKPTTTQLYTALFQAINSPTNLVRVESDINALKGLAITNINNANKNVF